MLALTVSVLMAESAVGLAPTRSTAGDPALGAFDHSAILSKALFTH